MRYVDGVQRRRKKTHILTKTLLELICPLLSRVCILLFHPSQSLLRVNKVLWRKIDFCYLSEWFGFNPFNNSKFVQWTGDSELFLNFARKVYLFCANYRESGRGCKIVSFFPSWPSLFDFPQCQLVIGWISQDLWNFDS